MPNITLSPTGIVKPEVGASDDTWGDTTNANWDIVNTLLSGVGGLVPPQGRLTLSSGVAVTTTDVTAAGTVYFTPCAGYSAPIWAGAAFEAKAVSEVSQASTDATKSPAAVAADKNYDLFVWSDGGTIRLSRGPVWSSDTARGTGAGTTELTRLQGVLVNANAITNGPAANYGTYVGTVRSTGASLFEDSQAKRFVWNNYQRRLRPMRVAEATDSWTATNTTWAQVNGSAANQLAFVCGQSEDAVTATAQLTVSANDVNRPANVGIGLSSTSTNSALVGLLSSSTSAKVSMQAGYSGLPGLGYRYLTALQRVGINDGTVYTFYGDNGGDLGVVSGIAGAVLA